MSLSDKWYDFGRFGLKCVLMRLFLNLIHYSWLN